MSEEPPDPLARLGERIEKARAARARTEQPAAADPSAMQQGLGLGLRIGVELVVAIGLATGLGWAIDRWVGTRPWGMIVLFFLGAAAGMLNVYRAVAGINAPVGYRGPGDGGAGGGVTGARARADEWDEDEN